MNEKAKMNDVSETQQHRINEIRELFSGAYNFVEQVCKNSRETSLAITKLEEAQFWAIKSISREEKENKDV